MYTPLATKGTRASPFSAVPRVRRKKCEQSVFINRLSSVHLTRNSDVFVTPSGGWARAVSLSWPLCHMKAQRGDTGERVIVQRGDTLRRYCTVFPQRPFLARACVRAAHMRSLEDAPSPLSFVHSLPSCLGSPLSRTLFFPAHSHLTACELISVAEEKVAPTAGRAARM